MKKILFIDRDGTLINEAPPTYQLDQFDKLTFYPKMFEFMGRIAKELDYELVMVTNQDGLGTASFPENTFWPVQDFMMKSLENEGIHFKEVLIDRSFPEENAPTRKPRTGMLQHYINNPAYDIAASFVIGDRVTDVALAKNLGCKAIWMQAPARLEELEGEVTPEAIIQASTNTSVGANKEHLGQNELSDKPAALVATVALCSDDWAEVYKFLKLGARIVQHQRNTNETKISIEVNMDGSGKSSITTGLGFFDHMLDQIARHGKLDLNIQTTGDLHIDEHHTIEDTGIALGEAFAIALADKTGMERYGFALPMDEAEAKVLIDFGGRSWMVWDAEFKRERIGEMPTEMFFHFFKSFSDAAKCNLHIYCKGENEHHKIEAIFKAFAKAIRMAVKKDPFSNYLPSTKGTL